MNITRPNDVFPIFKGGFPFIFSLPHPSPYQASLEPGAQRKGAVSLCLFSAILAVTTLPLFFSLTLFEEPCLVELDSDLWEHSPPFACSHLSRITTLRMPPFFFSRPPTPHQIDSSCLGPFFLLQIVKLAILRPNQNSEEVVPLTFPP